MKTKIYQTLFQKIKIPTYFNSVKLDHQGEKNLKIQIYHGGTLIF